MRSARICPGKVRSNYRDTWPGVRLKTKKCMDGLKFPMCVHIPPPSPNRMQRRQQPNALLPITDSQILFSSESERG